MPEIEEKVLQEDGFLERLLQDKDDAYRARILHLVLSTGIDPTDPVFLLLVATGRLEVMLEDAPKSLEKLLKTWASEFWRTVELTESVVVERQKEAIARAAQALIEDAPKPIPTTDTTVSLWSAPILRVVVAAAVAALIGGGVGSRLLGESGNTRLTAQDTQTLKWAHSKDGQLANNLVEWNSDYLKNRRCTKEVQNLGVELTVGDRVATSGYCVLWVVPPDQREFKEKQ